MGSNNNHGTKRSARRLLLVDDQPILREGFARLLDQEPDLKVCGQADSAPGALKAIGALKPDLVTVDIVLKGMNGIELVKQIKALHPLLPVLVLSMLDEVLFAERALRAGAKGYVMKQAPTDEVKTAIRRLLRGGRYLSPRMQERIMENLSSGGGPAPGIESLSDRELEVFQLIGNGCATRQIAQQLRLSIKTIETYRAHIKEKLKLATGMELIRLAVETASEQQRNR
jgi:DNA-binding NarL/FixJ family response regulator